LEEEAEAVLVDPSLYEIQVPSTGVPFEMNAGQCPPRPTQKNFLPHHSPLYYILLQSTSLMDDDFELSIPTEKDLSGTVFSDPAFFRVYSHITASNVMLYFAASPFYDQSNNLNSCTKMGVSIIFKSPMIDINDFMLTKHGFF
jgi:hypothetical protein